MDLPSDELSASVCVSSHCKSIPLDEPIRFREALRDPMELRFMFACEEGGIIIYRSEMLESVHAARASPLARPQSSTACFSNLHGLDQ